ncbi:MAG: hypothetical protein R3B95_02355 [Nitrospirales bacterium]|nr:hypothetical protein [Nitrospirales bacterium]
MSEATRLLLPKPSLPVATGAILATGLPPSWRKSEGFRVGHDGLGAKTGSRLGRTSFNAEGAVAPRLC